MFRAGHGAERGGHGGGDGGSVGAAVEQIPVAEVGRIDGPVLDGAPGGGFVGVGLQGEAVGDGACEVLAQLGLMGADLRGTHPQLVGARCVEGGEVDADEHGADQQDDRHGHQDGARGPGARRRVSHVQSVLVVLSGGGVLGHQRQDPRK